MNEMALQYERIHTELAKLREQLAGCCRCKADRTGMVTDMNFREVKPWAKKKHFDLTRRIEELENAADAMRLVFQGNFSEGAKKN